MTQRELDTIDERADKKIFELLCCAMTKCFVNGDRPTGRLARKHHEARRRFERSLPRGTRYVVDCEVEQDGSGNPWLLVMLCVIPGIPVNTVSSLYGSMNFGYRKFLLLSTLGFLPRLVSYTIVGRNAFDPLSIGFLLPLTIICILSAITLLSTNGVIMFVEHIVKKTKNSKKEKES